MKILPCLYSDSYKQFHAFMYPKELTLLFSNETARKSRMDTDYSVWFGMQYYIKDRLIKYWNEQFFDLEWSVIENELKRFHKGFSGVDFICDHWKKLHELGYLPLQIKSLPEGSRVPIRVPYYIISNTHKDFAWLVNFLETDISMGTWDLCVVSTISDQYKSLLMNHAKKTGDESFVQWQGHDFSMRGRDYESEKHQAGHLLSFTGTDTIPAVYFLEQYYNADLEKELIAGSVPATEHSVMMCRGQEGEFETFEKLLDEFPNGIISIVSDTWNIWSVLTDYLPRLKDKILARAGKVVIRPDSGDPADIMCGKDFTFISPSNLVFTYAYQDEKLRNTPSVKGVIELLWDVFGGTINDKGYKVLDPHIGAIYGYAITLKVADDICRRSKRKGFASTNWVAGIGSYTFNYNTRDSLGIAIKATYCELDGIGKDIFKDPITDDGTKKSAKGLLAVYKDETGNYYLKDQATWEEVNNCEFVDVFKDGKLLNETSLKEIRDRLIYKK